MVIISPNKNLQIGSLIAQGAEKFLGAYQGQQARNNASAMQRQRLNAETELRQMQMEKLRQETAPVQFDLQKMNLLLQGVDHGVVPDSVYNKQMSNFVDSIDSPAKLQVAQNALQQSAMSKANSMAPQAPYAPGQEPSMQPERSNIVSMSPKEAEFFGKMVNARGQMASVGQRRDASQLQYDAQMQNIESRMTNAKDERDFKAAENDMQRLTQERVARIRANALITSAGIRSNKPAGESPEVKTINRRVEILDKQIAREKGSPSGFNMDIPGEREKRAAGLMADRDQLLAQRDALLKGKPAGVSAVQKPLAGAPAPRAAAQAQANAFTRSDPGALQKMKALPEGSSFTLDGKAFKVQNGAPVPQE